MEIGTMMGPGTYKSGFIQERWKGSLLLKKNPQVFQVSRGSSNPWGTHPSEPVKTISNLGEWGSELDLRPIPKVRGPVENELKPF